MKRPDLPTAMVRNGGLRQAVAFLGLLLVGCGGGGIAHHPVGELAARSEARVDLVDLIIADPVRAARVKDLYLRVAQLREAFEKARLEAWRDALSAPKGADFSRAAEQVNQSGAALFREYAVLMGEVRALATEAEFERLNAVR